MQTHFESLVEQFFNIGSGFFLAMVVQMFVITPVFHLPVTHTQNISITLIFTVVSVARSFLWRRVFNHLSVKKNNKDLFNGSN